MAKVPFAVAVSHLCASQDMTLPDLARKCRWTDDELRSLFRLDMGPTERMLEDLARELMVDIAELRKML